jgi:hypothetical protein
MNSAYNCGELGINFEVEMETEKLIAVTLNVDTMRYLEGFKDNENPYFQTLIAFDDLIDKVASYFNYETLLWVNYFNTDALMEAVNDANEELERVIKAEFEKRFGYMDEDMLNTAYISVRLRDEDLVSIDLEAGYSDADDITPRHDDFTEVVMEITDNIELLKYLNDDIYWYFDY